VANDRFRTGLRYGLGSLFLGATVLQFANRQFFRALVPEKLAAHSNALQGMMAVALGGIGISFFVPRLRLFARGGTVAVLGGSLPMAVNQVVQPRQTDVLGIPQWVTTVRIPVQLLVLGGAWFATSKPEGH
jgi:uncharacterized membrane protein